MPVKSCICLAVWGSSWRGHLRDTLFCSTAMGDEAFSYLSIKISIAQGIPGKGWIQQSPHHLRSAGNLLEKTFYKKTLITLNGALFAVAAAASQGHNCCLDNNLGGDFVPFCSKPEDYGQHYRVSDQYLAVSCVSLNTQGAPYKYTRAPNGILKIHFWALSWGRQCLSM